MLMAILLFVLGLGLLLVGGEIFIFATLRLQIMLRISRSAAGIFIVGFGTSMPELITSAQAALQQSDAIAVGNIVGSNISNLTLLLGIGICLLPISCRTYDSVALAIISLFFTLTVFFAGQIAWPPALGLVVLMLAYVVGRHYYQPKTVIQSDESPTTPWSWLMTMVALGLGIIGIFYGASLMVEQAIKLARIASISESFLGLTSVAFGTSLPELGAIISAARRRQSDLILGNIIGSSIFNILIILPFAALIMPLDIPSDIRTFDLWIMSLPAIILAAIALSGRTIHKTGGILLIIFYVLWLLWHGINLG